MVRPCVVAVGLVLLFCGCADNPPERLDVRVSTLPYWRAGGQGSVDLAPFGGAAPYACSLKGGSSLPAGFRLSGDCILSGTAPKLSAGTTKSVLPEFVVIVSDSGQPQDTIELKLQLVMVSKIPRFMAVGPFHCKVDNPCLVRVADAVDGNPPYTFMSDSFATGAPPMGTVVDVSGWLTGKPTRAGTYVFGVCVKDVVGGSDCGQTSMIVEEVSQTTVQKRTTTTSSGNGGGCERGHHASRCRNGQVRCCLDGMECCDGTSCRPSAWC